VSTPELTPEERDQFESLLEFIKSNRGFDFTGYKRPTLYRRIYKRMSAVGVASFEEYESYLDARGEEFAALFDTILINVTSFFRDPQAWEYVAEEVVPRIVGEPDPSGPQLRVWSTGCASGEEAYTVAMVLAEALGDEAFRHRVKVYATDVDEDALTTARHGRFTATAAEAIPEALREKYTDRMDNHVVFRGDVRRSIIFGRHDVLQDPPISRVDLLVARNTLMYFDPETQGRVLANFHFALKEAGYLFLGKSEVLMTRSSLFNPVDLKRRVFQPVPTAEFRDRLLDLVHGRAVENKEEAASTGSHTREAAFDSSPVATLVVDAHGVLQLANFQSRSLFGLSTRDVGRHFAELDVSYRPVELRSRIDAATATAHPVIVHDVEHELPTGEKRVLDFQVAPVHARDGSHLGATITILDVTRYRSLHENVERSRADLETAYEELQATTEELETTNEELQSTNEELETTNEELQSTNEELETMNEELQSTNEELETMNDELRTRTDDLNSVNAFLDAILSSLGSGVIVLDQEQRVAAWNAASENLWGVRSEEAVGQHFLNLDIGLPVGELSRDVRAAIIRNEASDRSMEATNRRGRQVTVNVRIAPFLDGSLSGAILVVDDNG
jgi:two-component system CheB/CheR fusion protein